MHYLSWRAVLRWIENDVKEGGLQLRCGSVSRCALSKRRNRRTGHNNCPSQNMPTDGPTGTTHCSVTALASLLGRQKRVNSVSFSPQANCTDWTTATGWRNLVPTSVDRGMSRGQRGGSPTAVNLSFSDRSHYVFFQVAPHLSSWGWMDSVPDPLLLWKCGRAGNRTRYLWVCSQEFWQLANIFVLLKSKAVGTHAMKSLETWSSLRDSYRWCVKDAHASFHV
jgi:hypothetical protein